MQTTHTSQPHRAVILTALEVEYLAVRAHLLSPRTARHHHGTLYEIGIFAEGSVTWEVLIAEIGAGNISASVEAERAIEYFGPEVVLFAGVAGALKDVGLGDVVAATKVYNYASGKDDTEFLPRPDLGVADYGLEQRARFERKSPDWLGRIIGGAPSTPPKVFVAPIAAGEGVVTSRSSPSWLLIRKHYSDAVAVEMEGRGVLAAARANVHVRAMVIRGISDLVEDKSEADAGGSQEKASRHAAAFAFQVLARFLDPEPTPVAVPSVSADTAVTTSGALVMLGEHFFAAESVITRTDGTLVVRIRPGNGEEAAALRALIPTSTEGQSRSRLPIKTRRRMLTYKPSIRNPSRGRRASYSRCLRNRKAIRS